MGTTLDIGRVRICRTCKEEKPTSEYRLDGMGKERRVLQCRVCKLAAKEAWNARVERNRVRRASRDSAAIRAGNLRNFYGITTAEWDAILIRQGSPICEPF